MPIMPRTQSRKARQRPTLRPMEATCAASMSSKTVRCNQCHQRAVKVMLTCQRGVCMLFARKPGDNADAHGDKWVQSIWQGQGSGRPATCAAHGVVKEPILCVEDVIEHGMWASFQQVLDRLPSEPKLTLLQPDPSALKGVDQSIVFANLVHTVAGLLRGKGASVGPWPFADMVLATVPFIDDVDGSALHAQLLQLQPLVRGAPPRVQLHWVKQAVHACRKGQQGSAHTQGPEWLLLAGTGFVGTPVSSIGAGGARGRSTGGRKASTGAAGATGEDHLDRVLHMLSRVAHLCQAAGCPDMAGTRGPLPALVQAVQDSHGAAKRCATVQLQVDTLIPMVQALRVAWLAPSSAFRPGSSRLLWQALEEYMSCAAGTTINALTDRPKDTVSGAPEIPVKVGHTAAPRNVVLHVVVPAPTLVGLEFFAGHELLRPKSVGLMDRVMQGQSVPHEVWATVRAALAVSGSAMERRVLGTPVNSGLNLDMLEAIHAINSLTSKYEFQTLVLQELKGCPAV